MKYKSNCLCGKGATAEYILTSALYKEAQQPNTSSPQPSPKEREQQPMHGLYFSPPFREDLGGLSAIVN